MSLTSVTRSALLVGCATASVASSQSGLTPERAAVLADLREAHRGLPLRSPQPAKEFEPPDVDALMAQLSGVAELRGEVVGYGPGFKVRFETSGVSFLARGGDALGLRFESARVGERGFRTASVAGIAPQVDGSTVRYDHGGGLVERYDVGRNGVELSFDLAARPPGDGDLVVRLSLDTDLALVPGKDGDDLRFLADEAPSPRGVRIGAVVGIDADGRRVAGSARLDGTTLELVLPESFAAGATYPIVLDPPIGVIETLDVSDQDDHDPDVAYDETNQAWLVVWSSRFSASDTDIYGALVPLSGAPGRALALDVSTRASSSNPAVANVNETDRFLVVHVDYPGAGGDPFNDLRCLTVDASTGSVVGSSGLTATSDESEKEPAACGEPVPGFGSAIVAWSNETTLQSHCRAVQVPVAGAPVPIGSATLLFPTGSTFDRVGLPRSVGASGYALAVKGLEGRGGGVEGRVIRHDGTLVGDPTTLVAPVGGKFLTEPPVVAGDGSDFVVTYFRTELVAGPNEFQVASVHFDGAQLTSAPPQTLSDDLVVVFAAGMGRRAALIAWGRFPPPIYPDLMGMTVLLDSSVCESPASILSPAVNGYGSIAVASTASGTDPTLPDAGAALVAWRESPASASTEIRLGKWSFLAATASESVRVGTPPNPNALLPGQTTAPLLGATWDPVIDHATFMPAAVLDVLTLATTPANFATSYGTVLCVGNIFTYVAAPGVPFAVQVPEDCSLIGLGFCFQGASWNGVSPVTTPGAVLLTNAIDVVLGNE